MVGNDSEVTLGFVNWLHSTGAQGQLGINGNELRVKLADLGNACWTVSARD